MEYKINDEYRITSDAQNFILERVHPPALITKGKYAGQYSKESVERTFYSKLEHLFEALVEQEVRDTEKVAQVLQIVREMRLAILAMPESLKQAQPGRK